MEYVTITFNLLCTAPHLAPLQWSCLHTVESPWQGEGGQLLEYKEGGSGEGGIANVNGRC